MSRSFHAPRPPVVPREYYVPFILLTSCFALWGLLNNMTDNLVPAFQKIFSLDTDIATLVQVSFYGAYAVLAIPAAIIIKKYSYKRGVLIGLGLYMLGALGYIPGALLQQYEIFLFSIFVLAGGLSILETSCNPYIIAMGSEETSVRRLNVAQAFNPVGSLTGLFLGKYLILNQLDPSNAIERQQMPAEQLQAIVDKELFWLAMPYVCLVLIAAAIWALVYFRRMPEGADHEHAPHVLESLKRLLSIPRYYWGVIAQFFYVGVQITVWTFTVKYVMAVLPGTTEGEAAIYGIYALILFCVTRMVCTALMKYLNPASMMAVLAVGGILTSLGVIYLPAPAGIYCLVGISGCMSLMFPTIYGIALRNLGHEVKLGASGLIMAILGGAVITQIHGAVIDKLEIGSLVSAGYETVAGLKGEDLINAKALIPVDTLQAATEMALRYSFYIAAACFAVVLIYSLAFRNAHKQTQTS